MGREDGERFLDRHVRYWSVGIGRETFERLDGALQEQRTDSRGALFERLGPVVWERSVEQASHVLEELEETARLWLMTHPRPQPLDAAAIDELRTTFGARY